MHFPLKENVATFAENNFFFIEPGTMIVGTVHSVASQQQADEMKAHGYKQFGVMHIMEMGGALLHLSRTKASASNEAKTSEDITWMPL